MENKSFINGVLYGLAFAKTVSKESLNVNPIMIWFEDGTHLSFAINRGIEHAYNNMDAMITAEDSYNLFDISVCWVNAEQKETIERVLSDNDAFEKGKIRATLNELHIIINSLGTIDIKRCHEEWLSIGREPSLYYEHPLGL